MKWFNKRSPDSHTAAVQVRQSGSHPFGALDGYVPMRQGEMTLYHTVREAIPVVDAAILKLVRLCGGVSVQAENPKAQKELEQFLKMVDTGRGQRGIQSFLDGYLDAMLTYGRGVGEIVLDGKGREICALLSANPTLVEIREGDHPLEFQLCARKDGGEITPLKWQELLLFTPFQPESENPYGTSLLRSMPFLAEILLKIYHSIGMNWERMGNVRFAVICKTSEDERAFAQERCRQVAGEWSSAMQSTRQGAVRDFVAVGDVDIKVIGADNQILDSEVPVRQILEQLIARTGIPPFMLGLSWSSTERMSTQQADLLTSELTAIRRSLEPVVERICELWLSLNGFGGGVIVDWADINLQDQVEEARAHLYRTQAEKVQRGDGL